jgi:hypothetical protein
MKNYHSNKYREKNERQEDKDTVATFVPVLEEINNCINILKINKEDSKLDDLIIQNATHHAFNRYGKRIIALKTISELFVLPETSRTLSQSELYDFLTLAAIEQTRAKDMVFKIYRDIMENYQNFNDSLKLNYPKIIVDIIAVLTVGEDTNGQKVGINTVDDYYQSRKSKASSAPVQRILTTAAKAKSKVVVANRIQQNLIEALARITGRQNKDLKESLNNLRDSDIKKISDLCANYNKIEKYCKLTSSKEFRIELEKEVGRKLTNNQVQSAVLSIRKLRKYIENQLDDKFVTHGSHGINHIKHNLEYGYQIMGLIKSNRRRES